jgi:hypothetical protein
MPKGLKKPKSVLQLRRGEDGLRLSGEAPKYHQFSTDFVMKSTSAGEASLTDGMFILDLRGGKKLKYKILEAPGRFSKEGKPVVEDEDKKDTDEVRNFFEVELVG